MIFNSRTFNKKYFAAIQVRSLTTLTTSITVTSFKTLDFPTIEMRFPNGPRRPPAKIFIRPQAQTWVRPRNHRARHFSVTRLQGNLNTVRFSSNLVLVQTYLVSAKLNNFKIILTTHCFLNCFFALFNQ